MTSDSHLVEIDLLRAGLRLPARELAHRRFTHALAVALAQQ
jgi:hypothetical protein